MVVGVSTTLLAQSSAPSDNKLSEDPHAAPCIVKGRVVAAADGNPLKSARVALTPERSHFHNQFYTAISDNDGLFTLKNVRPGRYQFFATRAGFVEQHYNAGANDNGPIFSLRPGEKVSDVLFRVTAAAVITGRVSNEDGKGMQRLEVVALRWPSEEETEDNGFSVRKTQMRPVVSAESDDRGQYRSG